MRECKLRAATGAYLFYQFSYHYFKTIIFVVHTVKKLQETAQSFDIFRENGYLAVIQLYSDHIKANNMVKRELNYGYGAVFFKNG